MSGSKESSSKQLPEPSLTPEEKASVQELTANFRRTVEAINQAYRAISVLATRAISLENALRNMIFPIMEAVDEMYQNAQDDSVALSFEDNPKFFQIQGILSSFWQITAETLGNEKTLPGGIPHINAVAAIDMSFVGLELVIPISYARANEVGTVLKIEAIDQYRLQMLQRIEQAISNCEDIIHSTPLTKKIGDELVDLSIDIKKEIKDLRSFAGVVLSIDGGASTTPLLTKKHDK